MYIYNFMILTIWSGLALFSISGANSVVLGLREWIRVPFEESRKSTRQNQVTPSHNQEMQNNQ